MSFNVSKCKVMHVSRNNPDYEYTMRGQKLETTDEERDIRVMTTKNLKPSVQCEKTAGRAMTVLRRNFHYRERHTPPSLQTVRPTSSGVFSTGMISMDGRRYREAGESPRKGREDGG
jgi:hypothetical protein